MRVLLPFLCPLVIPFSQVGLLQTGARIEKQRIPPTVLWAVCSGTCTSMAGASVGSCSLTEAALYGWNVPFVPLTISNHLEPDREGGGESMGTVLRGWPWSHTSVWNQRPWPLDSRVVLRICSYQSPKHAHNLSVHVSSPLQGGLQSQPWARPRGIPRRKSLENWECS